MAAPRAWRPLARGLCCAAAGALSLCHLLLPGGPGTGRVWAVGGVATPRPRRGVARAAGRGDFGGRQDEGEDWPERRPQRRPRAAPRGDFGDWQDEKRPEGSGERGGQKKRPNPSRRTFEQGCDPAIVNLVDQMWECSASEWERAISLYEEVMEISAEISAGPFRPREHPHAHTPAIRACGLGGHWEGALSVFRQLRRCKFVAKGAWSRTIHACSQSGQWEHALSLFDEMKWRADKGGPNLEAYKTMIVACSVAERWQIALALFEDLRLSGIALDADAYGKTIKALGFNMQAERAVSLFRELQESKLGDVTDGMGRSSEAFGYLGAANAVVGACGAGGLWEQALSLFRELQGTRLKLKPSNYQVAIGACEKCGQAELAESLEQELQDAGLDVGGGRSPRRQQDGGSGRPSRRQRAETVDQSLF